MSRHLTCPSCGTVCVPEHKFCPGCGFPMEKMRDQAKDPLIGCTLPGGHVVMELIDVGGMGRVYRAEQKLLGRTVAVKIIHPHLLGDETVEARFITEARAASQLNHPNSVGVIDFGKFDGRLYMVMEYIRGRDLATVAHEEGPLEIDRVVDVLCQTLAALEEAHHNGIIHRDLKPENIVLSPLRSGGDFVKVLDFGLAKVLEAAQGARRITDPGMVCGTPEYMAPEQARGDDLDRRVDLYACGVLLYELIAGQLPFDGKSPREVVLMHLSKMPPDLKTVAPHRDLPAPLVAVVTKAMSKSPEDRFQSATEFATTLKQAVRTEESIRPPAQGTMQRCDRCGSMVPAMQKFCGDCGAKLIGSLSTAPVAIGPRGDAPRLPPPFRGRERELEWLRAKREQANTTLTSALVVGPPGSGRSRLLRHLGRDLSNNGDLVIHARPDPWWAMPGYHVLREIIRDLGQLPDDGGSTSWPGITPEARAGMMTIFGHSRSAPHSGSREAMLAASISGGPSDQRVLVADALRWALGRAHNRSDGIVVLIIDDLESVDGTTRNALIDVLSDPPLVRGLILGSHTDRFTPGWEACESLPIGGLSLVLAGELLGEDADLLEETEESAESVAVTHSGVADGTVSPLYIEQLIRFGAEGGSAPPRKLADLIAMRIERLPVDARRVLQAIAVLGDATTSAQLVALVPDVNELTRCLSELRIAGFIQLDGGEAATAHPLIRDVTVMSTPHAVRTDLHANARRDFGVDGMQAPLEAQALHAYHAGESFEALMLLEQSAQLSHARDDHDGAVNLWHLALELARREMARGELDDPIGAVLMFSAKLGDALALAGKPMDAHGVLSEALDLAAPSAAERPRLLASLANAERISGRTEAAYGHLEEALRLAEANKREDLVDSLEEIRSRWVAGF